MDVATISENNSHYTGNKHVILTTGQNRQIKRVSDFYQVTGGCRSEGASVNGKIISTEGKKYIYL